MASMLKKRFLEEVRGPVFSLPTPFTEEGKVDYQSLEEYVDFLINRGAKNLIVSIGTSRFDLLTIKEMMNVNEVVVKAAMGRAITLVTTPPNGPTSQAVRFAQHAESIGADGILGVYPDRFFSEEGVYKYFEEMAQSCSIGVLIHEMPMRSGKSGLGPKVHYSPELVEKISRIDNMVGMKEESEEKGLEYQFNKKFSGNFLVIGCAGMRAFLLDYQWGQQAYMVAIGHFAPEIDLGFYAALTQNDIERARGIVFEKEGPFFDEAGKMGWQMALREAMEVAGLMKAWGRKPMLRLDPESREKIGKILSETIFG